MALLKYLRLVRNLYRRNCGISYAQCGEDLILWTLLVDLLKIPKPTYLDIGANHPVRLSNTYLFYTKGCHGVCVEPNPLLCAKIRRARRRDRCLNIGVGTSPQKAADFYLLSHNTLSTFSKEEAETQTRSGECRIKRVIQIDLVAVEEIISRYFPKVPNLVSLDTEGHDAAILRSFNFEEHRPEVFCVETLTYPDERKITDIKEILLDADYRLYADTYINSIFVEQTSWTKRGLVHPLRLDLR